MNFIKRTFLNLRNRNKKPAITARKSTSYDKAKNIGILFTSKNLQNTESLSNLVTELQKDGKQVKALSYFSKKYQPVVKFNFHFITEVDISIFGEITSIQVNDFVNSEFDYLLCVDIEPFPVFGNILLRSKAKCRIGKYYPDKHELFELMINMPEKEGTDYLIQQMAHYVKAIKNDEH